MISHTPVIEIEKQLNGSINIYSDGSPIHSINPKCCTVCSMYKIFISGVLRGVDTPLGAIRLEGVDDSMPEHKALISGIIKGMEVRSLQDKGIPCNKKNLASMEALSSISSCMVGNKEIFELTVGGFES